MMNKYKVTYKPTEKTNVTYITYINARTFLEALSEMSFRDSKFKVISIELMIEDIDNKED